MAQVGRWGVLVSLMSLIGGIRPHTHRSIRVIALAGWRVRADVTITVR